MMRGILSILIFSLAVPLYGETVAWWRFEDNGNSQANADSLSLEISPTGIFEDTDLPGPRIIADGVAEQNQWAFNSGSNEAGTVVPVFAPLNDVFAYGSFTVEAFVRIDEEKDIEKQKFMRVIGSAQDGGRAGWAINISELKLRFSAVQGLLKGDVALETTKTLQPGKWHHVAAVGTRSPDVLKIRLFLDGEECEVEKNYNCFPESPGGEAIIPSEKPVILSSKNRFRGKLDEIRISDTALGPDELLRIESPAN